MGAALNKLGYYMPTPPHYQDASINVLELLNIYVALKFWAPAIAGKVVQLYCDNAAAVYTLTFYKACHTAISSIARDIWVIQVQHNITLAIRHIAGININLADARSRIRSLNDVQCFKTHFSSVTAQCLATAWVAIDHSINSSVFIFQMLGPSSMGCCHRLLTAPNWLLGLQPCRLIVNSLYGFLHSYFNMASPRLAHHIRPS